MVPAGLPEPAVSGTGSCSPSTEPFAKIAAARRIAFWSAGALSLALAALPGGAEETSLDARFEFDAYARRAGPLSPTDLVPSPESSGYPRSRRGLEAVLRVSGETGNLEFDSQLRLSAESGRDATVHIDEAFAEIPLGDRVFVYAGRRIRSWGQSYGLNPADPYRDPLRENDVLAQSRAHNRVEGADMAGADLLFDSGNSLELSLAPDFDRRDTGDGEDFGLLRFSGFGGGGAFDYAVSAMSGDRPGLGLSLSMGAGFSTVLYADAAFRRGREKSTVAGVTPAGALEVDARETGGTFAFATLGVGHVFDGGLALNAEYSRDEAGYSGAEWVRIEDALDMLTPVDSPTKGRRIGRLNETLDHYTLRRNYGFIRVAHDAAFGTELAIEATALHGFDDGSGSVGLRLEYPATEQVSLGLKAERKYGGKNSEFALRPETGALVIYFGASF